MKYHEMRALVSRIVPGTRPLLGSETMVRASAIKEKGRKKNYSQYNLLNRDWESQQRLLKTDQIDSFLEVSLRAAACPMPLNLDVWDGLKCPYGCIYCFADTFRASLYTSFFDNSKTMGLRHCSPDYYKRELDKMLHLRSKDHHSLQGVNKAFSMGIPIRFGIRFEDFTPAERRKGVSLTMLKYLKDIAYPVMINTKSDLVGEDEYVRALSENPAKAAVHITILTSNEELTQRLEPGAPSYAKRLEAARILTKAGVRVVARIEPQMFLVNDDPQEMEQYAEDLKQAGVNHITLDTYSYSANIPGIRQTFINRGIDFDRMFLAGSDSQKLGSLLLRAYIDYFRERGFSCSTFDLGNIPDNNQDICCEVLDWFAGTGAMWNYGSMVVAIRFIKYRNGAPTTWGEFRNYVMKRGGFLTPALEREVHELWNIDGSNIAYSPVWVRGMVPVGWDEDGLVWSYIPHVDERYDLLESLKAGLGL